jgi:hypothetical protein
MVTATLHAASIEELTQIGGWVHDAYFDWRRIEFDAGAGVVTVPFAQQPAEAGAGEIAPRVVDRTRFLRLPILEVPFVRCLVTVRHPADWRSAGRGVTIPRCRASCRSSRRRAS